DTGRGDRLLRRMAQSRHATGSARTRRSLDNQRDGPFSTVYRAGAFEAATAITRITPNRKRHHPLLPVNSSATTSPSRRYCAPTEGPRARPDHWVRKAPRRIRSTDEKKAKGDR